MNVYTRPLFRQAGGPAQPMAQDMGQEIERVAGQLDYLNTMIAVEPNLSTKTQLIKAMQNLAKTTPPEVFNAAFKLMRDAEASRSPDVMANPNMDPGNRSFVSPVNRANGGEIMPPAMQQGMAPPPEAAMLERAEMMASQQAEQLGAQYAQDMMQNVDSAESAEDLINAMRGNQMPLEARREELGGLVGMEDANATPESVLALVQPVIMMTEEGAINSGIGELMQGIIGDVEMTTEGGMPTEMGQGVGGLMMAGAQEAPAPQNFNQGGAVQKFSNGGIAEVRTFYEELLPLYKDVLGQEQEDVNMAKAGGLFDIAGAGLALASGVDPRTGKSMAGQPFGAQLAAAASPLPEKLGARAADIRKQERAIKAAALEGAVRRGSEAEQYRQAERIARIKQRPPPFKSEMKVVEMPDGSPRSFNVDTEQGAKDFSEAIAGGAREVVRPTKPTTTQTERGRTMFSENYDAYADGTLDDATARLINMFLTDEYGVKTDFITEYDPELGQRVKKPVETQAPIPQTVIDAVSKRSELGKSLPAIKTTPPSDTTVGDQAGTTVPAPVASEEAIDEPVSEATRELESLVEVTDMSAAFGTQGALAKFFNKLLPAVSLGGIPPLAPDLEGLQSLYGSEANAAVTAAIVGLDEKSAKDTRDMFRAVTPNAGQVLVSPYEALQKHEAFLAQLKDSIAAAEASVQDPTVRASQASLVKAKKKAATLRKSLNFWETATRELRKSLYGGGKTVEDRLNEMGMEPTGTNIIRQMNADVESVMSGIQ